MKRSVTALVLALTMLLSLTACTSRKDKGTVTPGNDTHQNDTANNNGGSLNGNTNNGTMNGGTNTDPGNGSAVNPSDGSRYGNTDKGSTYGTPGYNSPTDSESSLLPGRSYEDMLRNGRVRDSDGFLNDGENHASEW